MTVSAKAGLKPGVEVVIGGQKYTAPPLNLGAIREMHTIERPANDRVPPYGLMAYVLMRSLQRNYDGVEALWLNETLEGHEIEGAMLAIVAIMEASGLVKPAETNSGEAPAAA